MIPYDPARIPRNDAILFGRRFKDGVPQPVCLSHEDRAKGTPCLRASIQTFLTPPPNGGLINVTHSEIAERLLSQLRGDPLPFRDLGFLQAQPASSIALALEGARSRAEPPRQVPDTWPGTVRTKACGCRRFPVARNAHGGLFGRANGHYWVFGQSA
jgi:hypothetical protein